MSRTNRYEVAYDGFEKMVINPFAGGRYIHSASSPIYLYVHALITQRRAVYQKKQKEGVGGMQIISERHIWCQQRGTNAQEPGPSGGRLFIYF